MRRSITRILSSKAGIMSMLLGALVSAPFLVNHSNAGDALVDTQMGQSEMRLEQHPSQDQERHAPEPLRVEKNSDIAVPPVADDEGYMPIPQPPLADEEGYLPQPPQADEEGYLPQPPLADDEGYMPIPQPPLADEEGYLLP